MQKLILYCSTIAVLFTCAAADNPMAQAFSLPPHFWDEWESDSKGHAEAPPIVEPPSTPESQRRREEREEKRYAAVVYRAKRKQFYQTLKAELDTLKVAYTYIPLGHIPGAPYLPMSRNLAEKKSRDKRRSNYQSLLSAFHGLSKAEKAAIVARFEDKNIPTANLLRTVLPPKLNPASTFTPYNELYGAVKYDIMRARTGAGSVPGEHSHVTRQATRLRQSISLSEIKNEKTDPLS